MEGLTFSLVTLVIGITILLVSRSFDTFEDEDEKWKDESWMGQGIFGPPGYRRATGILLGVVLIIFGVVGIFATLLSMIKVM